VVHRAFRVHEHEGRPRRLGREPSEGGELVLRLDRDEAVVRLLDEAHLQRADLVAHRVAGVHLGHPADRPVQGRGEEHRLTIGREPAHDTVHLWLEPHVEHPVGLVEHEDVDAVEPDEAAFDEIVEPPRSGDQDVGGSHALRLFTDPRPAVDGHDPEVPGASDVLELVAHLLGELARGREDQGDGAAFGDWIDLIDDGDRESEGLPGSGL
jgi:hypothetical protein